MSGSGNIRNVEVFPAGEAGTYISFELERTNARIFHLIPGIYLDPNADSWHVYDVRSEVDDIQVDVRSTAAVLKNFLEAPASDFLDYDSILRDERVYSGDVTTIQPLQDVVSHEVNSDHGYVINITDPQRHIFTPGIVIRSLYVEDGQFKIQSFGVGNGRYRWFNLKVAEPFWDINTWSIEREARAELWLNEYFGFDFGFDEYKGFIVNSLPRGRVRTLDSSSIDPGNAPTPEAVAEALLSEDAPLELFDREFEYEGNPNQGSDDNVGTYFLNLTSEDLIKQFGFEFEFGLEGPSPTDFSNLDVNSTVLFVPESSSFESNQEQFFLREYVSDAIEAVENLGTFLTRRLGPLTETVLSNDSLSRSTEAFLSLYGRSLLAGELDPDDALIEFARFHVRNVLGRELSQSISKSEALDALVEAFEGGLGLELKRADQFAQSFATAFSQMALSFTIDSGGWNSEDYTKAGLSILAGNITSYAVTYEIGSIFGQALSRPHLPWLDPETATLELTPEGHGLVAATTALVGGLLEGYDPAEIALNVGLSTSTSIVSAAIAESIVPSLAVALELPATLISSAVVPVIGLAVGYVAGEIVGEIIGGKEYEPHEYENLQLLRDSEFIVTEENGERVVVATSPDGTTIKLFEHQSQVAIGGPGADTLAGNLSGDHLFGNLGNDFLDGLGGDDELVSGEGDDHIEAGTGNDFAQAGPGNDITYGGEGNDYLDGNEGNDLIHGEAGDDAMIGSDGADVMYGGPGDDEIVGDIFLTRLEDGSYDPELLQQVRNYVVGSGTRDDFIDGGDGDDFIRAGEGRDLLVGGGGNDILEGQDEADDIFGGIGNDQIFGGSGSDFVHAGPGTDIIQGDSGDDFLLAGAGVDFVTGGIGHDVLDGGDGDDNLVGEVGNDFLLGGPGDDELLAGYGDDVLIAGPGIDLLRGEHGNDKYLISDGDGVDRIIDREGANDVYFMDASADELRIEVLDNSLILRTTQNGLSEVTIEDFWLFRNFDTLHFSDGKQVKLEQLAYPVEGVDVSFEISAEASDSVVSVEQSLQNLISAIDNRTSVNASNPHSVWYESNYQTNDYVIPETFAHYNSVQAVTYKKARGKYGGHYTVVAKSYPDLLVDVDDRVVGSWWSENIVGTGAAERFYGNDGKDILEPGPGDDLAFGGAGDDEIFGGDGNDYLVGGSGDDNPIAGQAGNDTLFGSEDDDFITGDDVGQSHDDVAYGGDGDDEILGRDGNDLLHGDRGADTIEGGLGKDVIIGGHGDDILIGDDSQENTTTFPNFQGDSDVIYGNDGNDTIFVQTSFLQYGGRFNNETSSNYAHGGDGDDTIYGANGEDTVYGGGDQDFIRIFGGNDWAHGGAGNDVISGGNGDDIIYGGDEDPSLKQLPPLFGAAQTFNDFLMGGLGADYIYGGDGDDFIAGDEELYPGSNERVNYGIVSGGNDVIYGGRGNDVIDGHGGNDFIIAGEGDDSVFGSRGNDQIFGSAGDDQIFGQLGDDVVSGGHGRDRIDGGEGNDTVSFLDQITPFGISAFIFDDIGFGAGHVAIDVDHSQLSTTLGEGTWEDTFWGVENIKASHGDDRIWGNDQSNALYGMGGDDLLHGGLGADILDGGEGTDTASYLLSGVGVIATLAESFESVEGYLDHNDQFISIEYLIGSELNDLLGGDEQQNFLYGASGDDHIKGGAGDDQLFGEIGNDRLEGGEGNDSLFGWEGFDQLHGEEGDDTLAGQGGPDWLFGGPGDDHLVGDTPDADGNDFLYGGDGNDRLEGAGGDDYIEGNSGNDQAFGWTGNDTINGGDGDDALFGDDGDDELAGANGADTVFGGNGNDTLWGGPGEDTLNGDRGNDTVNGESGDDRLYGGEGDDLIYGGTGEDFLLGDGGDDVLHGDDGNDNIFGFTGNDTIYGGPGNDQLAGEEGDDVVTGDDGDDVIYGDGPNATGNDQLFGGEGNDVIRGNRGNDLITGDDGRDELYGDDGDDSIFGGRGDDYVHAGDGDDELNGGDGNDALLAYEGNDLLLGEDGDDQLFGLSGDDRIEGGRGDDIGYGDDGKDELSGGEGNDLLSGWNGPDSLWGGEGNDELIGENGDDVLSGGPGDDILFGDRKPTPADQGTPEVDLIDTVRSKLGFGTYGLIYQDYDLVELRNAPHELLIISPGRTAVTDEENSEILFTGAELSTIKSDGKLLFGYLNTSKINTFNAHWDPSWLDADGFPSGSAAWLGGEDPNFQNTWLVNYWEDGWKEVLEQRIDVILDQGFDGLFLDDVLEYFFRRGSDTQLIYQAAREMRDLVVHIHSYADQKIEEMNQASGDNRDPEQFRIVVNGAPYIILDANENGADYGLADQAYFDSVDAILTENYVSLVSSNPSYADFIEFTKTEYANRDIVVLALDGDQVTQQQRIETMRSAVGHGFLPFATENLRYDTLNEPLQVGYGDVVQPGNDVLEGGLGIDLLEAGAGDDVLKYSADAEWDSGYVAWNTGTPTSPVFGQRVSVSPRSQSNDVFHGGPGFDVLEMTDGNDALALHDGQSASHGGNFERVSGVEHIKANEGDDLVDLSSPLIAYPDVLIEGGDGNDVLWASSGNDDLRGEAGNDQIDGADGDDLLNGGPGDDELYGRLGNNELTGDLGADKFFLTDIEDSLAAITDFRPVEDSDLVRFKLDIDMALASIEDYVMAREVNGGTEIFVDPAGRGRQVNKVAELQGYVGVDVREHFDNGFFDLG